MYIRWKMSCLVQGGELTEKCFSMNRRLGVQLVRDADEAFERLRYFPGVQKVNVTPLGRLTPAPWHLFERAKARIGLADFDPMSNGVCDEVLAKYRPGQNPLLLKCIYNNGRYG